MLDLFAYHVEQGFRRALMAGGFEHERQMDVHATNGRRVELWGELAALTVLAEQLGPAWQSRVLLVRASQALLDGRFDDARPLAEVAARIGGEHSDAAFLRLRDIGASSRLCGLVPTGQEGKMIMDAAVTVSGR